MTILEGLSIYAAIVSTIATIIAVKGFYSKFKNEQKLVLKTICKFVRKFNNSLDNNNNIKEDILLELDFSLEYKGLNKKYQIFTIKINDLIEELFYNLKNSNNDLSLDKENILLTIKQYKNSL